MTPTTNSRPAIGLFLAQILLLGCVGTTPQNSNLESMEPHSNPKVVLPGYVVKRPSGAKRVLVLIHGITGDGTSSWTNHNGTYWPSIMKGDSEFQDFDIYVYEYPTDAFGQCLPITDLANTMRTHLKNDNVFSEHEQVVFLAHSMGGLVIRQFLLRNREAVDNGATSAFLRHADGWFMEGKRRKFTFHLLPSRGSPNTRCELLSQSSAE